MHLVLHLQPLNYWPINTEVAELVDAHVSGACELARAGSSPAFGTQSGAAKAAPLDPRSVMQILG